jgi:hypothetical protein
VGHRRADEESQCFASPPFPTFGGDASSHRKRDGK